MVKYLLAGLLLFIAVSSHGQSYKLIPGNVLDFGEVEAGDVYTANAWILNLSDTPLIINGVPNSGGNLICNGFSHEPALKGDSLKVSFIFHPNSGQIGIKHKGFTVKTNLGDQNIYVTARVVQKSKNHSILPSFDIVPGKTLNFGEVEIGDTPKMELLLINTSDVPLVLTYVGWGEPCIMPIWSYEPILKRGDTAKIAYKLLSFDRQQGKISKVSTIITNAEPPYNYLEIKLEATLIERKKRKH